MNVRAASKGYNLFLEQSADLPEIIIVSAERLKQTLINLVGNAIKFTEKGKVVLRVSQTDNQTLRFEVEDTGFGIPKKDRDKIFEPFVQLDNHNSKEAGTGLGLAISKKNMDLMGGTIGIDDSYREGALFYFQIPLKLSPESVEIKKIKTRQITGIAPNQPRYKIMIAEDQPQNTLLLKKILEPFNFEVKEAVNGKEACDLQKQWTADFIFMDIRMPVVDGVSATKIIKADPTGAKVKIIAITAHAMEQERVEILAAGCDNFIRKPYHEDEIMEALATHLGVKFIYADTQSSDEDLSNKINISEELSLLPPELIEQLLRAALLLDTGLCSSLIEKIEDQNTARQLKAMVANFKFKELITLLNAVNGKE